MAASKQTWVVLKINGVWPLCMGVRLPGDWSSRRVGVVGATLFEDILGADFYGQADQLSAAPKCAIASMIGCKRLPFAVNSYSVRGGTSG